MGLPQCWQIRKGCILHTLQEAFYQELTEFIALHGTLKDDVPWVAWVPVFHKFDSVHQVTVHRPMMLESSPELPFHNPTLASSHCNTLSVRSGQDGGLPGGIPPYRAGAPGPVPHRQCRKQDTTSRTSCILQGRCRSCDHRSAPIMHRIVYRHHIMQ